MLPPATPTALLFGYAFLSNIALAVVPHEPAIIWYGPRLGLWTTTLVATAGPPLAALADPRVFGPLIGPMARPHPRGWPQRPRPPLPLPALAPSRPTAPPVL